MKPAAKPTPKPKPKLKATPAEQSAIDRANRAQAMETAEMRKTKTKKPMPKYAKGGKIDGIAKKGKTKTKMVKMAMGGLTPRASMMMGGQNQGGPAMATFKRGGSCGMKKGK